MHPDGQHQTVGHQRKNCDRRKTRRQGRRRQQKSTRLDITAEDRITEVRRLKEIVPSLQDRSCLDEVTIIEETISFITRLEAAVLRKYFPQDLHRTDQSRPQLHPLLKHLLPKRPTLTPASLLPPYEEETAAEQPSTLPTTLRAGQLSEAEVVAAAGDLSYVYYVHNLAPQTQHQDFTQQHDSSTVVVRRGPVYAPRKGGAGTVTFA
ncbi:unnamed protein product [Schistocephalus solidus]|uniref:BHLH domain-containing protein n=1 Tax=Schistocephalus solidus TaxID=70667 RepID=A0A183T7T1_SCHSO|nr:unnamed protein product [Schistocephalus solidus]